MEKLFTVVKTNKDKIIKGALLVGGTILGAVLANTIGPEYEEGLADFGTEFEFTPEDHQTVIDIEPEEEK